MTNAYVNPSTAYRCRLASAIFAWLALAAAASWSDAADSTAYLDLRLVFEDHWEEVYSDGRLLQLIDAQLRHIKDDTERAEVNHFVWQFTARGFQSPHRDKRLFAPQHQQPGATGTRFLKILQGSQFRLTPEFLTDVYDRYRNAGPGQYDFEAFVEPAWIEFSSGLREDATAEQKQAVYQGLVKLLDDRGGARDIDNYLQVLFYGYGTQPANNAELDSHIRKQFLDRPGITPQDIGTFYKALTDSPYWTTQEEKRRWMLTKTAWRLYNESTPEQWATLPEALVLDLAKILAAADQSQEYERVPLDDWLMKMGQSIKAQPDRVPVRTLLAHFLDNAGLDRRETFSLLEPLFRDDQAMFVALHESPPDPSPMAIWHGNAKNLQDSTALLQGFLKLERADRWNTVLWQCLGDYYYVPHQELRETLFEETLKPIYQAADLQANPLRREFLSDVSSKDSFLNPRHRYEVAHYLLAGKPMTDPAGTAHDSMDVLAFAIAVFDTLPPTDADLYRSAALRQRLAGLNLQPPATDADRMIAYVNGVLGEPLEMLCHAFLGKTDKSNGVRFSLADPKDKNRVDQLETLLRRIVDLKGQLRRQHNVELKKIAVLEELVREIVREMRDAVEAGDQQRIVTDVKLTLMITLVLGDDSYLETALKTLREDVFGVPDDPALFRRLPPEELQRMVTLFGQFHSEHLLTVIREFRQAKYLTMFYDELYVPLRSIYGFMDQVGAEPYIDFLDEFQRQDYEPPVDLNDRWEAELDALGRIHGEEGGTDFRYINAERAIAELLTAYLSRLSREPWRQTETIRLSKNVNLGVLYRILFASPPADWKMAGQAHADRARRYRAVAEIFLDNLGEADRMDRPVALDAAPAEYSRWYFFPLLHSLADLYEIHGFPFKGLDPDSLYTGSPDTAIERNLLTPDPTLAPRKVDGRLRARVAAEFQYLSEAFDAPDFDHWESIMDLLLLLPNREENNQGDDESLALYERLKGIAFTRIQQALEQADDSAERLRCLLWLARLETSVFGLKDDQRGFGYETVCDQWYDTPDALTPTDWQTLGFEEFRLLQVNQPEALGEDSEQSLLHLAAAVHHLIDTLARSSPLLDTAIHSDSFTGMLLTLERQRSGIVEPLPEHQLENFWFLTTQCRDLLAAAAARGEENLTPAEKQATVSIITSWMFLYSYFVPYVGGEFNVKMLFSDKEEHRTMLPLFCMFDREMKKPMVSLLQTYGDQWETLAERAAEDGSLPPLRLREIKMFFVAHNFLPLHLLEVSLDDFGSFRRLVEGEDVKLTTYNFRLLWKREDRGRVSFETLCDEVFDGVECNRQLLTEGKPWSDDDYLDYFFGDMRRVIGIEVGDNTQMPQNFDMVVRKFATLPEDPRLEEVCRQLRALRDQLPASGPDRDKIAERRRVETALRGVENFRNKVDSVLSRGYEYFGEILAEQFHSPFSIQKACESAGDRIAAAEPPEFSEAARQSYSAFYESGLFAEGGFRPDILQRMVNTFYVNPTDGQAAGDYRSARRGEFLELIGGREAEATRGFAAIARKAKTERTPFDRKYLSAGRVSLQSLFCGRFCPDGRPFIGDVMWKPGEDPARPTPEPLDYDHRADDIRDLLLWVYEAGLQYKDVPEIRSVFVPDDLPLAPPQDPASEAPSSSPSVPEETPPPAPPEPDAEESAARFDAHRPMHDRGARRIASLAFSSVHSTQS